MLDIVRGITLDGKSVGNEKLPRKARVMSEETAQKLRKMMISAVYENENSNARARYIRVAAKTSTAQTGRIGDDGEEYCNAWITGFFPASSPTYAVTVLVEDGGYGNDAAAPVFAEIAEGIMK
jgi:penicillin-binding protein 2